MFRKAFDSNLSSVLLIAQNKNVEDLHERVTHIHYKCNICYLEIILKISIAYVFYRIEGLIMN